MRIGLVGCVKGKAHCPAPAAELYVSPLFVGRRRFVESSCDRWLILSALHGLVDPDEVIEPYDQSLVDVGTPARRAWAKQVLHSIDQVLGDVAGSVFEIHAGAAYRDFGLLEGLRRRGAEVVVPAAGLSQGQQLAFYPGTLKDGDGIETQARPGAATGSTGYLALADWLRQREHRRVTIGFGDLEAVLGRPLPPSARRHRPWWANNDRAPQARAWLGAGWQVAGVDLAAERVTFEKTTT